MKIKRIVILILISAVAAFAAGAISGAETATVAKTVHTPLPSEESIVAMSAYDGRDYGIITPVRDQGSSNLCWAYSSAAASEASILKSGVDQSASAENLRISPEAAAYRVARRGSDPLGNTSGASESGDFTKATGNPGKVATLYSGWWGPVCGTNASVDPFENPSYRLETVAYVPNDKSDPDGTILAIKRAVAKYGAVTFQYNNLRNAQYYNPAREKSGSSSPHACTVIGWDDGIEASVFAPAGASRNGGWLIKNSYSDLPYFYLSYDNTSSSSYAFAYAKADEYDRNYYYDGDLNDFSLRSDKCVANVYSAAGGADGKDEFLKAVNVGVDGGNYTLEVEIYKNLTYPFDGSGASDDPVRGGTLVARKTASFEYGGYVTVRLDEEVRLEKGEWFSVVVRITSGNAKIRLGNKNGENHSFVGVSGGWSECSYYVGRIKAYTVLRESEPQDESTFTNLLVFARFAGESEFINDVYAGCSVRDVVNNTYNKSVYSLSGYLNEVSRGKVKMRTLYLTDGGSSLELTGRRGYYAQKDDTNPDGYEAGGGATRMYDLKRDWTSAVLDALARGNKPTDADGKTYDYSVLDRNADGKIDCITVIYAPSPVGISAGWGSPLWDYRDYCSMVSLTGSGKTYVSGEYVQLTFSYKSGENVALYKGEDGLPIVSVGKVYHEAMHVFGLKDLYRSDLSSAVYFMSLMGKPMSPVGQYVSVKERESLGWLDSSEVVAMPSAGEYTLSVAHGTGVVGYKVDLPSGKTLYLEYRRFDDNANKYDSYEKTVYSCRDDQPLKLVKSFKSGLVCYLVNTDTRFPSNIGTSGRVWNFEVVSHGTSSTRNDSAVGLNESLDIAGGVRVEVTGMTGNSLTFRIDGDVWNAHVHNLEKVAAKPAGCFEDGNIAHFRCAECGKLFSDEAGKNEITAESVIIPAVHEYGALIPEKPATCTEKGKRAHYECRSCGRLFDEYKRETTAAALEIPVDNTAHEYGALIPEKPATCTEKGKRAHYECRSCGRLFDEHKRETTAAALEIPIDNTAHEYGGWIKEVPAGTDANGTKGHKDCLICKRHFDADGNEISDLTIPATGEKPSEKPDEKPEEKPSEKPEVKSEEKPARTGGLSAGGIAAVAVSGSAAVALAAFAIVWFAIGKKSFADLAAAIKRIFRR